MLDRRSHGMLVSMDMYQTGLPKLKPLIRLMVTVMFSGSIATTRSCTFE